jgi:competence protein ComEA
MKRRGERREERGEGRLIAAVLIVLLALSLGLYLKDLPRAQLVLPRHDVPAEVYAAEKVNINTASQREIAELPGVGEVLAGRIILYRENVGPFESPEDLLNVYGIGMGKLEAVRWYISVE